MALARELDGAGRWGGSSFTVVPSSPRRWPRSSGGVGGAGAGCGRPDPPLLSSLEPTLTSVAQELGGDDELGGGGGPNSEARAATEAPGGGMSRAAMTTLGGAAAPLPTSAASPISPLSSSSLVGPA